MLRCAGCGGPVSEWAARCPACGHPTDDAVEDPRRRHRIRRPVLAAAGLAAAGLAVAGIVAVAVTTTSGGGPAPAPAVLSQPPPLPGRVVAQAPDGTDLASGAGGHHQRPLPHHRFRGGDRLLLAAAGGVVIAARGRSVYVDSRRLPLAAGAAPVGPSAPADGGRAVLVRTGSGGDVSAVTLPRGAGVDLGPADSAVGDPAAVGAFVSVVAARQPGAAPPWDRSGPADARIELRDAGKPTAVLGTAPQLNRDAGLPPDQPVHLGVFPAPDGSKVAVMLNPAIGGDANSAMVVVDRGGRMMAVADAAIGPIQYSTPYWSPDGSALAYTTFGTGGTSLAVLAGPDRVAIQDFQPSTSVDGCAWSPDSAWLLCQTVTAYTSDWVLARNSAGLSPIYSFPARGRPLIWLRT